MKRPIAYGVLLLALSLTCALALTSGAAQVSVQDWRHLLTADGPLPPGGAQILWHIRLPRAGLALLAGAALGLSGALTQGLFRNPLADPGLLGVSSGAAAAAALALVALPAQPDNLQVWILPGAAFGGALLLTWGLNRVARWLAPGSIATLLLCGIALNALAGATIGLCTWLADDAQLRSLSFWMLGSLAGATWPWLAALLLLLCLSTVRLGELALALNALALGPAAAMHAGIDVARLQRRVVWRVAALCGFVVAWCGMIGFVGLIAAHLVRSVVGADQRLVLPLSLLTGAWLLLMADTLARTMAIPAEIPVGIFTALLGAPFFLALLTHARARIG